MNDNPPAPSAMPAPNFSAATGPRAAPPGENEPPPRWSNGQSVLDGYRVEKFLGRGAFGEVYWLSVEAPERRDYAVKCLKLAPVLTPGEDTAASADSQQRDKDLSALIQRDGYLRDKSAYTIPAEIRSEECRPANAKTAPQSDECTTVPRELGSH